MNAGLRSSFQRHFSIAIALALAVLFVALVDQAAAKDGATSSLKDWSSLAGEWDTTFGKMQLSIQGSSVKGKYAYNDGVLEGTIDGNGIIDASWKESDGKYGKAVLKVTSSSDISGTWGFMESATDGVGGGKWVFKRPKQ